MITDQPPEGTSEKPSGKTEKVRGMNATLTPGVIGSGGLKERDPTRLNITRRQVAFALVLAILGVIAAIFTVNSISSGTESYQAVVTTSKVYDLNFATTGKVTSLSVKVGQRVTEGQVLASQDTTSLQQQVSADESVVKADQAALSQAQAPQITAAQKEQDALQIQQAQTALSNAESALSSAEVSGKAAVNAANESALAAQDLAKADETRYNSSCPKGPVPPAAGLTGAALQAAEAQYTSCETLQQQFDIDTSALTQAEGQVQVVQAQAQGQVNQAQSTVNSAEATLNLTEYEQTLQTSPTNMAAATQAQAQLSQAQGQLAVAQQALKDAELVAPDNGTVAEVYGAIGENLGPTGVFQYQGPQALAQNSSTGFNLFPSQTVPNGGGSSSGGYEPLIEVVGGQQQVTAEIPESKVTSFQVGRDVQVSISSLRTSVSGVVTAVVLSPTRANTSVTYDVIITLDHSVGGLLPGMSATVRS